MTSYNLVEQPKRHESVEGGFKPRIKSGVRERLEWQNFSQSLSFDSLTLIGYEGLKDPDMH